MNVARCAVCVQSAWSSDPSGSGKTGAASPEDDTFSASAADAASSSESCSSSGARSGIWSSAFWKLRTLSANMVMTSGVATLAGGCVAGTSVYDPGSNQQAAQTWRFVSKARVPPTISAALNLAARRPPLTCWIEKPIPNKSSRPKGSGLWNLLSSCERVAQNLVASVTSKTYCGFWGQSPSVGGPPVPESWEPGSQVPR